MNSIMKETPKCFRQVEGVDGEKKIMARSSGVKTESEYQYYMRTRIIDNKARTKEDPCFSSGVPDFFHLVPYLRN